MPLEGVPRIAGFIIGIAIVLLVPYLLKRGLLTMKVRVALLAAAIISGVLFFAPMTPVTFIAGLYQLRDFRAPLLLVIAGFSIFIVAAWLFGRSFCGYACPIGAAQEVPYMVPTRKWVIRQSFLMLVIRGFLTGILVLLALLAVIHLLFTSLLLLHGVRDLFLLESAGLPAVLFIILLVVSVFLYRPFCRYACPYGALMSLAVWKSLFRIQRTGLCNGCGACEAACPTGECHPGKEGNECYLCGRCLDACPVRGGIGYLRREKRGARKTR
jgi:ferredoxin-type protein NapH